MPPYFQMMARRDASELMWSQFLSALMLSCGNRCKSAPSRREEGGGHSGSPGPGQSGRRNQTSLPKIDLPQAQFCTFARLTCIPPKLPLRKKIYSKQYPWEDLIIPAFKDFMKLFLKILKQWEGKVETQTGFRDELYESFSAGCPFTTNMKL